MSQIRDEIDRDVPSRPHVTRSQADVQRIKLEKLMKNPDKRVVIPEKPKERGPPVVPDFVRNVMGSSAGAGSGEFHVYRHLRRKEYARQHYMHKRAEWELMEGEYHAKIESNKRNAEEATAKKRAKRLLKKKSKRNKIKAVESSSEEDDEAKNSVEDVALVNNSDRKLEENSSDVLDKQDIVEKFEIEGNEKVVSEV